MLYFILVLILIIVVMSNNKTIKDLKEENTRLKKHINSLKEYIQKYIPKDESVETFSSKKFAENSKETVNEKIIKERVVQPVIEKEEIKVKRNSQDDKNIMILITGAVLIVLAAIVFLMSTWYTIPNILKTLVLVCLISVFMGASRIAKEKFKLEKASMTFFFIAMAYIPICLYSISIFQLFGEYLSIYGEGKYIYLTISSILVSVIYYIYYRKTNNNILMYGSVLAQELTVILFTLVLKLDLNTIFINLGLYNLLLIFLTSESKTDVFSKFYNIIPFVILVLNIFNFDYDKLSHTMVFAIAGINFLILEIKNSKPVYSYLFNILYMATGITLAQNNIRLSDMGNEIFLLTYSLIGFLIENLLLIERKNSTNLKQASLVTTIIFLIIFELEISIIKNYFVTPIIVLLSLFGYKNSKEMGKTISSVLISIYFIFTGAKFIGDLELSYHYYIIFSIITFILGEFITGKNAEILRKIWFTISHIFIIFTYLSFIDLTEFKNDVIYMLLLMIVYVYSYFRYPNLIVFKYLSYITSNLVILFGCNFFKIESEEFLMLIPTITTVGIILLENKYKELVDNFSKIYLSIVKIQSFILLANIEEIGTIVSLILAGFLIYNNINKKENEFYNIIPLAGIIPNMISADLGLELRLAISLLFTVGITVLSLYKTKISVYTVFSFIYMTIVLEIIDNEFCNNAIFILWSVLHTVLLKNTKQKDIFKILTYIGTTNLYYEIIDVLNIDKYALFEILGILILAILSFKNVVKKYIKDIDGFEYVIYGLIYFSALSSYNGIEDGMLFVLLLLGIIVYSYMKKYGTLFITTIIALLVNVFLITLEFWLMIPWWLYLLVIGAALISFAIRNEAKENNEKLSIGNVITKIKDKIEN